MSVSMGIKMSEQPKRWTLEEFLAWEEAQPERYELVDGQPQMMTGGSGAHSAIKMNLYGILYNRLRGSSCRPFDSDRKALILEKSHARYPDAMIDCSKFDPDTKFTTEPTVVFEVLSKSNGLRDQMSRLEDYGSVPTIRIYVVISQDEPFVTVFRRNSAGVLALSETLSDLSSVVRLDPVCIEIPLSDLYENVRPDDPLFEQERQEG